MPAVKKRGLNKCGNTRPALTSSPAGRQIRCRLITFFPFVGLGSGSSRSLQAFPKDLVVEFGRNAVFLGKVEAAGFLRPVLRVMSRLYVGTGGELHLRWIQPKCG